MVPSAPRKGVFHQYTSRLTAFEHTPSDPTTPPQNLLIFIGGLFDGLLTVPYTTDISNSLPPGWTLAQVLLSSSYNGWGTSSLQKDVKEISKCVAYFRTIKTGKIVLMGHSTGCQDVMEYLTGKGKEDRSPIDGGIIQAPASDREFIVADMKPERYNASCAAAQALVDSGNSDAIISGDFWQNYFPCPVSAYRWLSLASPNHDGDDDYFSSDLTDDQLMSSFGALPAKSSLCIIFSGNDEYMSAKLDKETLLRKWVGIVKRGVGSVDEVNSGVIEGATHSLDGNAEEIVHGLVKKVLGFLDGLEAKSHL